MPPSLRKSQPNLSKPSEGGSSNAGRKSSEGTNPLSGLNLTGERELGSAGGVKATGKLTVGVDNLIGQQGVDIEIDATNRTAGLGVGIGSTKGKLGVNIGGKIGYDETGKISIRGAEAGINIGGFGGSASIDEDEGIRGSVSIAGAKVEIGIAPDGKKSVSLCYGVPGGELCVTFEPEPGTETPIPIPIPTPPTPPTPVPPPPPSVSVPNGNNLYWAIVGQQVWSPATPVQVSFPAIKESGIPTGQYLIPFTVERTTTSRNNVYDRPEKHRVKKGQYAPYALVWVGYFWEPLASAVAVLSTEKYNEATGVWESASYRPLVLALFGTGKELNKFFAKDKEDAYETAGRVYIPGTTTPLLYHAYVVGFYFPVMLVPLNKVQLPNYPQHFKPMNCCNKVEEIYKYLGIAKLKKNKFPVSNAFLVPGGSGNDDCFDYYSIMQALFRMLANGLIINPKSKPLGSEWQNVNATAWASAMYEMMAESMSDGNSTQRFEVAAIMQLVQMTSILAENGRKIEFVADAIGLEPQPTPEEVPVCFTIYERHKGFGKKEPKKINLSGLKTDDDVENALGKMLNPSLIPITAWKFKPGQISISEALRNG